LGRLVLEKEEWKQSLGSAERQNCCVTFSDASADVERAIAGGHNCCVTFSRKKDYESEKALRKGCAVISILIIIALMVIGITAVSQKKGLSTAGMWSWYENNCSTSAGIVKGFWGYLWREFGREGKGREGFLARFFSIPG
jgi:hypothetical protein